MERSFGDLMNNDIMNFLIKRFCLLIVELIDFCQEWKTRIFKDEIIEKKLWKNCYLDQWIIANFKPKIFN